MTRIDKACYERGCACYDDRVDGDAVEVVLAQEQEPVVWVKEDVCDGQYIDGRPRKIWWECNKGVGTAFYTRPPQRTWVGLTDEQIDTIGDKVANEKLVGSVPNFRVRFARAIEAKLKEKNT
jgi:hypothetical protein